MAETMKPLYILQACGSRSWGGLEMEAVKTALGLQDRGHSVALACPPGSMLETASEEKGLRVYGVLDGYKKPVSSMRRTMQLLRSARWDIVHTHLSHDLSILTPALGLTHHGAKLFLTKHMASGIKKTTIVHMLLYRRLESIFTISNYIRGSVLNTCPVPPRSVFVLHNGIDLSRYDPQTARADHLRERYGISRQDTVIGMVGRVSRGKGHREFIRASAELTKRISRGLKFVVVGGSSYGEESLFEEMKSFGKRYLPDDKLIFTGQQDNIPEFLSLFDILAFPSHEESFGNVLLEAMAMRVPVIACDSGGVPDIVTPGTGLLIPPRDHEALCEALSRCITDTGLAHELSEAGRKRVETYFTLERHIDRLLDHYYGKAQADPLTG